jgi:hypothetical protein
MSTSFFVWIAIVSLMVGLGWPMAKGGPAGSSARISSGAVHDVSEGGDPSGSADSGSGDSSDDSGDSD